MIAARKPVADGYKPATARVSLKPVKPVSTAFSGYKPATARKTETCQRLDYAPEAVIHREGPFSRGVYPPVDGFFFSVFSFVLLAYTRQQEVLTSLTGFADGFRAGAPA